jgi:phage gp36-like protein
MYATRADLAKRFGERETALLEDPDNSGVPSSAVSISALADASDEADSYVSVRFTLPLPSIPQPLVRAVCDIARFRLYKDRPTDEVTYRYERTIKWLEQLATGKVMLTFAPALTPQQVDTVAKPVTPQSAHYAGGVFSDANLDRLPQPERGQFGEIGFEL